MALLVVGIVLLLVAGGCFWGAGQAKKKEQALMATQPLCCRDLAETLDAVTDELQDTTLGQVVEINGAAKPGPTALAAPLSGRSCVWYRSAITQHYREYEWQGSEANKDRRRVLVDRSRQVSDETSSDVFVIDDGTGTITVDVGDAQVDEPRRVMDRRVQDDDGWANRFSIDIGSITIGGNAEGTTGYQHEEWVLDVDAQLFAVGRAVKHATGLRLVKPTDGQPFIVSTRTEEELRKSAGTNATVLRIAALAAAVAGLGTLVAAAVA